MPSAPAPVQTLTMQGIQVPASSVDPTLFFSRTRRLRFKQESAAAFAGLGATDQIQVRQTGIIAKLNLKFSGTLTVTPGTGTVATTMRWPYDIIKRIKLSANGQSNLLNCSGAKLRAREFMAVGNRDDRGVTQGVGGASPGTQRNQGTLSKANESWGVGAGVTAIAAGAYDVELTFELPVAWDEIQLTGAIFAQTASTSLQVEIDWASPADLFVFTGNGAAALTGGWLQDGTVFSIPQGPNGDIVVPDLSIFHALVQSNDFAISTAETEVDLAGTGVGRQLMRLYWQLWSGAVGASAPLPINAANFGAIAWRHGGNETPEVWNDGTVLAYDNEAEYNTDLGAAGFAVLDWASKWAFRDSIDEGTATNLRAVLTPVPALVAPRLEYVQETMFAGSVGA